MKRFFQIMAIMVVSLMFAASAAAYTIGHNVVGGDPVNVPALGLNAPQGQQVSIAESGVGDLLIFPVFAAAEALGTEIKVVNTCPVNSQVVKIVVREHELSEEVRDFYIYLSPNDAWYAQLYWDGNAVRIRSTDDSMRLGHQRWASEDDPYDRAVIQTGTEWMGYITAFNVMSSNYYPGPFDASVVPTIAQFRGDVIEKEDIFRWFSTVKDRNFPAPDDTLGAGVPDGEFFNASQRNVITGSMDLVLGNNGAESLASLTALAFEDFNVTFVPDYTLDMAIHESSAWNNLDEVEAILSKRRVMMPFEHSDEFMTLHMFTFPTKYDGQSTFFNALDEYQNLPYSLYMYDMEETLIREWDSPMTEIFDKEVDWSFTYDLAADDKFGDEVPEMGWIDYHFNYLTFGNTARFDTVPFGQANIANNGFFGDVFVTSGAPVIPVNLKFGAASWSLSYGAHGDSFYPVTTNMPVPPAGGDIVVTGNEIYTINDAGEKVAGSSRFPDAVATTTIR